MKIILWNFSAFALIVNNMSETLHLFLLALLGSIVALVGGVTFLFKESWSDFLERHSVPFAAGVLLTVSLLGLLPEAVHLLGEAAFLVALVSLVGAYIFEHILFKVHHHHANRHSKSYESAIPLVIFGDTLHNLIDGVAITSSFLINPGLGLVTAISTFLHEVPHEISDFGILLKVGWKKKDILIVNVLSASTTIVGAFLVYYFLRGAQEIGTMLAFSAGLFLYLGASDFLPEVEKEGKRPLLAVVPLLLGVAVMYLTLNAVPHTHEGGDEHSEAPRSYEGELLHTNE